MTDARMTAHGRAKAIERLHRIADALERESLPSSGDTATDIEAGKLHALAVVYFRVRARELEGGR